MILVTRLDRQMMFLNPDHIVTVEETPDTVITLFNGHHILVREKAGVIINRIVSFRTRLMRRAETARNGYGYLNRARRQRFSSVNFQGIQFRESSGSPLHHQDLY